MTDELYIAELEHALEDLVECFTIMGNDTYIDTASGPAVVSDEVVEIYEAALDVLYGGDAEVDETPEDAGGDEEGV